MVVYADILIVLNLLVNYFLLAATSVLLRIKAKALPVILSALLGAAASLYIFLPGHGIAAEALFKVLLCFAMAAVAYRPRSLKLWFKQTAVFFGVTCAYGGIMAAVWHLFAPSGMVIHNSVVYFNISPTALILGTAAAYIVLTVLNRIFSRSSRYAGECDITVNLTDKVLKLRAILDTGNSITDVFGKSEIIITDKRRLEQLVEGREATDEMKKRFRAVPCKTVSGDSVLTGYRCDSAVVSGEGKTLTLKRPILVSSEAEFTDGYNAIVNPEILE